MHLRRPLCCLLAVLFLFGQALLGRPAAARLRPAPVPTAPVTRADFAGYLAAALELPPAPPGACPFLDVSGEPAREAVAQVHQAGVMSGFPGGAFRPGEAVTRAQAVAVLLSAARRLPAAPACTLPGLPARRGAALPFADVPPAHWAHAAIASAWEKGLAAGTGEGRFLPDRPVSAWELRLFFERFLGAEAAARAGLNAVPAPQPPRPVPAPTPGSAASAIPILLYHHLAPRGTGWDQNGATLTPEEFAWQMDRLALLGYKVLSAGELEQFLSGRLSVPARTAAITFDDGYASNLHYALPVLKRHGFPAIINVITGTVPDAPLVPYDPRCLQRLSWPELRRLSASGLITLGSHSEDLHAYVPSGPQGVRRPALVARLYNPTTRSVETEAAYRARIRADLTASRDKLARELGAPPHIFAYPYGVSDPLSRRLVAEAGFTFTFGTRPALARRGSGLTDVPRLVVRPGLTPAQFDALLAGK